MSSTRAGCASAAGAGSATDEGVAAPGTRGPPPVAQADVASNSTMKARSGVTRAGVFAKHSSAEHATAFAQAALEESLDGGLHRLDLLVDGGVLVGR